MHPFSSILYSIHSRRGLHRLLIRVTSAKRMKYEKKFIKHQNNNNILQSNTLLNNNYKKIIRGGVVPQVGLEPTTYRLQGDCSTN